jgi:hypothetical protein
MCPSTVLSKKRCETYLFLFFFFFLEVVHEKHKDTSLFHALHCWLLIWPLKRNQTLSLEKHVQNVNAIEINKDAIPATILVIRHCSLCNFTSQCVSCMYYRFMPKIKKKTLEVSGFASFYTGQYVTFSDFI